MNTTVRFVVFYELFLLNETRAIRKPEICEIFGALVDITSASIAGITSRVCFESKEKRKIQHEKKYPKKCGGNERTNFIIKFD